MFSYVDSVAKTCKSHRPPSKAITLLNHGTYLITWRYVLADACRRSFGLCGSSCSPQHIVSFANWFWKKSDTCSMGMLCGSNIQDSWELYTPWKPWKWKITLSVTQPVPPRDPSKGAFFTSISGSVQSVGPKDAHQQLAVQMTSIFVPAEVKCP